MVTEIVEMLLNRGANINPANQYGITALHNAVRSKTMEIIELLLKKGAYVNARDSYSVTPLQLAVENGSEEIVKLLLKHGAYVNSPCDCVSCETGCPNPCRGLVSPSELATVASAKCPASGCS